MRTAGDELGVAETLNSLGMTRRNWGDYDRAAEYFEEALRIYRELNDPRGVSVVLNNMGTAAINVGDLERAAVLQEESLDIRRRIRDAWGIAIVLNNMAEVAFERGRFSEAEACCRESLSIRRELNDQNSVALVLATLGAIARARGDTVQAFECHRESLQISRDLDHPGLAVSNIEGMAEVAAVGSGDTLLAARVLGAAEAIKGDMRVSATPMDRSRFDTTVENVRSAHARRGDQTSEEFDTAWLLGRSLTLERATAEALSVQISATPQTLVSG
jgi:tetratricopeptide (TPR) repeat protein